MPWKIIWELIRCPSGTGNKNGNNTSSFDRFPGQDLSGAREEKLVSFIYLPIRRGVVPSGAAAFIAITPGRAIFQKYPGYLFSQGNLKENKRDHQISSTPLSLPPAAMKNERGLRLNAQRCVETKGRVPPPSF